MSNKPDKILLSTICAVINEWDPYALLASGRPADEFDSEIQAIANQIHRVRSPIDAAHTIARVFSSSFDQQTFSVDSCTAVGARLFNRLKSAKLVD